MANFDIGETIICSCEVKGATGAYKDPQTSMKITITDRNYAVKVDAVDMTKDAVGKYHYDFQAVDCVNGKYEVVCKATDGTRITIQKEFFTLQ